MGKHKDKKRDDAAGVTLNDGRRYQIKGNAVNGYYIIDTHDERDEWVVYESKNVQDCHSWRNERDEWEKATGRQ